MYIPVNEYWDGPGVADFCGVPHIYNAIFDEQRDDYSDSYALARVDQDLLSLVLEDWEIWLRWDTAHQQGSAPIETHPALPADRLRHEQLATQIGQRLTLDGLSSLTRKGRFRSIEKGWQGFEVEWE